MSRLYMVGSIASTIVAVLLLSLGIGSWDKCQLGGSVGGELPLDSQGGTFGEVPVGRKSIVRFKLTNKSRSDIYILGAGPICTPLGCLNAEELPPCLPSGNDCAIGVAMFPKSQGDFACAIDLFINYCGKTRILPLKVSGRFVAAPNRGGVNAFKASRETAIETLTEADLHEADSNSDH